MQSTLRAQPRQRRQLSPVHRGRECVRPGAVGDEYDDGHYVQSRSRGVVLPGPRLRAFADLSPKEGPGALCCALRSAHFNTNLVMAKRKQRAKKARSAAGTAMDAGRLLTA